MKKIFYIGLLAAFFPFLVLGAFNHPSADDFSYTNMASHGFWQAQKYWYLNWEGRYFTTVLLSLNPLGIKSLALYQLMPLLLAAGLVHALYLLVKELGGGALSRQQSLTAALVFCLLYVANMPDICQAFYWFTGAWTYQSANILLLYLLTCIARVFRGVQQEKMRYQALSVFLALAIAGSNETVMVLLVCMLSMMLAWIFWSTRRINGFLALVLLAAAAGGAIVMAAPGNAVRMAEDFPTRYGLSFAVPAAAVAALKSIFHWAVTLPVAGMTVIAVMWARQVALQRAKAGSVLFIHPVYSLAAFWGLLAGGLCPSFWSMGGLPPGRIMDLMYFVFLLGWFFNVYILTEYAVRKGLLPEVLLPRFVTVGICLFLFLSFLKEDQNIRIAYSDLLSGKAAAYGSQVAQRHEQLAQCGDTCEVGGYVRMPRTIYFDDITRDPTDWRNKSYSEFFHKNQIVIKS